jgi:ketosteroid isomerase-like protein
MTMETEAIQTKAMQAEFVEETVLEHLAAFGRGDFDAWGAAFAADIFFSAADPEEVFSSREDVVTEMHDDFAPAFDEVLQALTSGILPAPRPVGYAIGAGAQALVGSFKHQLADFSMSAIRRNAHAFGPFPGEDAEGETAVRALFAKWTSRWGVLRLRPDGVRAEFISETMGWVCANVDAILSYTDQLVALPLRVLVVYQKEGYDWAIVHAHLSVGIPDELAEN